VEAVSFANIPELKIDMIAATGDFISAAPLNEAAGCMASFFEHLYADNYVPTFPVYGNHDSNTSNTSDGGWDRSQFISSADLYRLFDNDRNYSLKRPEGKNYYYADLPDPGGNIIRVVALDMLDQPWNEIQTLHTAVYSQQQIDWLGNVALRENMTDRHHVIILSHFPFLPSWSQYLKHERFLHGWQLIPELVEAFRKKERLTETYLPNPAPGHQTTLGPIVVDADFSDVPGTFVCYLGGHIHTTARFQIKKLRNASDYLLPQNMLLCTTLSASDSNSSYTKVRRVSGTATGNSFCIYALDTRERKIYLTFFGAWLPEGSTPENYPEIQIIPY
jgi:DNA repair exonuclease SbcCD nuclease subunit